MMKKLHEKETEGSKFLIKPAGELEKVNTVATILTPYYGLTLKHARNTKWKGKEAPIKRLAKGLCLGLNHMHDTGIAHRDIKPDNILFVNRKSESPIKVVDFGLSDFMRKIEAAAKTVRVSRQKIELANGLRRSLGMPVGEDDPAANYLMRKVMPKAGTPHYMAPEMHQKSW